MIPVLQVSNLRKSFGGIAAVNDVSFEVCKGEILGIIGPNGSGKSTLFNCVLGQLTPNSGEIHIDGRATTGMRPCDLNRLGVSRTFQLLRYFRSSRCATTSFSRVRSIRVRCIRACLGPPMPDWAPRPTA
jgi:branched-chain amino acid transport system ATP-binding protein